MPSDVAVVASATEAHRALEAGQHVFLTNDDVPLDDELALKTAAGERGLLVISRTAILDGTPLGFANDVRRGTIGVIGTAGSASQEVTTLVDQLGAGVSQAIRSGNRDLSDFIGGLATVAAIELLAKDDATSLIVLLAKAPAARVAARVLDAASATGKPIVACLLGVEPAALPAYPNVKLLTTFEGAALSAATQTIRSFRKAPGLPRPTLDATIAPSRYCLRGLYAGGALAYEALALLAEATPQIASNLTFRGAASLAHSAETHTVVALSQGGFREGRAHRQDSRRRHRPARGHPSARRHPRPRRPCRSRRHAPGRHRRRPLPRHRGHRLGHRYRRRSAAPRRAGGQAGERRSHRRPQQRRRHPLRHGRPRPGGPLRRHARRHDPTDRRAAGRGGNTAVRRASRIRQQLAA
jgi:succinyl-CoA synthetase alpha subunit